MGYCQIWWFFIAFPYENVHGYELFHRFSPCLNSPPWVSSPLVIQTPWCAGHQQDMLLTVQHLATSELHYSPSRCWGIHFSSLVWWFFIARNARKWRNKIDDFISHNSPQRTVGGMVHASNKLSKLLNILYPLQWSWNRKRNRNAMDGVLEKECSNLPTHTTKGPVLWRNPPSPQIIQVMDDHVRRDLKHSMDPNMVVSSLTSTMGFWRVFKINRGWGYISSLS